MENTITKAELHNADIILYSSDTFISKLIQFLTVRM